MKKRLLILPLLAGFALSSCSVEDLMFWQKKEEQQSQQDDKKQDEKTVTSVKITGSKSELTVGAQLQLSATVVASEGLSKTVEWKSSNTSYAIVTAGGLVTAKAEGTVTITAKSVADPTKTDSVTIKIMEPKWSDETSALFEEYFGEIPPVFNLPSGFVWTDEYYEDYRCLTAELSGDSVSQVVANIRATGAYTVTQGSESYIATCNSKLDSDFEFYIDIYLDSSDNTAVDVYYRPKSYSAWPSQLIGSHLSAIGIEDVTLPEFSVEGASAGEVEYSVYYYEYEDESRSVIVSVTNYSMDAYVYASDYADVLDATELYSITEVEDEEYSYICRALDKSHTILIYENSSTSYDGFILEICGFIPDYQFEVDMEYPIIEVGNTITLHAVLGEDIPEETVVTFASGDNAIATVDENGVVQGVSKGSVVITVTCGTYGSKEVTVYVEDEIATDFSNEEKGEIEKVVEGLTLPYSAYFESAAYSDEDSVLFVSGKVVSFDILFDYYIELLSEGWTDLDAYVNYYVEYYVNEGYSEIEARYLVYTSGGFDGYFGLEKVVTVDDVDHHVMLYAYNFDETEGEMAYDGTICLEVSDPFIYSYDDALAEYVAMIEEIGEMTAPEFPENLPAAYFSVSYNEEYAAAVFSAYETEVTIDQLLEALTAKSFVLEKVTEQSLFSEITYLKGKAPDGVHAVEAYVSEGTIVIYFTVSNEVVLDFVEDLSSTSGTVDGISFSCAKNSGQSDPAYNGNNKELRLYDKNSITLTSETAMTSIHIVCDTCTHSGNGAPLSCDVGTLEEAEDGYIWTGSATSVTFTANRDGDAKQCHITSISIK